MDERASRHDELQDNARRHLLQHFARNGAFGPDGGELLVLDAEMRGASEIEHLRRRERVACRRGHGDAGVVDLEIVRVGRIGLEVPVVVYLVRAGVQVIVLYHHAGVRRGPRDLRTGGVGVELLPAEVEKRRLRDAELVRRLVVPIAS